MDLGWEDYRRKSGAVRAHPWSGCEYYCFQDFIPLYAPFKPRPPIVIPSINSTWGGVHVHARTILRNNIAKMRTVRWYRSNEFMIVLFQIIRILKRMQDISYGINENKVDISTKIFFPDENFSYFLVLFTDQMVEEERRCREEIN